LVRHNKSPCGRLVLSARLRHGWYVSRLAMAYIMSC